MGDCMKLNRPMQFVLAILGPDPKEIYEGMMARMPMLGSDYILTQMELYAREKNYPSWVEFVKAKKAARKAEMDRLFNTLYPND